MNLDRLYLYVPPEDEAEVKALGARRDPDPDNRCWYLDPGDDRTKFSQWLPGEDADEQFWITSDRAYVASAMVPCQRCGSAIEVICVYCESGTVLDEPLSQFTVSNIRAVDQALAAQLAEWPTYRETDSEVVQRRLFANHCPHCGTLQEDRYLHSEPEDPFFGISHAGPLKLKRLAGQVRLSDESYEI